MERGTLQRIRIRQRAEEAVPPLFLCLVLCFFSSAECSRVHAEEYRTVALPADPLPEPAATNPANFSEILRALLLECLKTEYVEARDWKGTVERFDGFRVRGGRISKREREVPHGIWHRYRAHLIRPEQSFDVSVAQLAPTPEGAIPFSILITLRARCEATFVWWTYGVKGANGTVESDCKLQLQLVLETSPKISFSLERPLPRVELRPCVTKVELKLKDFDLRRVGIWSGDVVKVIGDGSTKVVEAFIRQQEEKIRQQLQKSLDKVD